MLKNKGMLINLKKLGAKPFDRPSHIVVYYMSH